jgi:hypothetical protein
MALGTAILLMTIASMAATGIQIVEAKKARDAAADAAAEADARAEAERKELRQRSEQERRTALGLDGARSSFQSSKSLLGGTTPSSQSAESIRQNTLLGS